MQADISAASLCALELFYEDAQTGKPHLSMSVMHWGHCGWGAITGHVGCSAHKRHLTDFQGRSRTTLHIHILSHCSFGLPVCKLTAGSCAFVGRSVLSLLVSGGNWGREWGQVGERRGEGYSSYGHFQGTVQTLAKAQ